MNAATSRWLFCAILFAAVAMPSLAQPVTVQNLIVDDGTAETSVGDGGQFMWFNRFTPPPADYPLEVTDVEVMFGATLVNVGDPVDIYFFEDTDGDGDPGTGVVLLDMISETVQFNDQLTFSSYELAIPVFYSTPGDVLIGVVNRAGSEGFNDFPAAIDQGASQVRSWAATWLAGDVPATPTFPADEQWGTIDSFGLPGNWMVRATYNENIPVELVSFNGVLDGTELSLTWATASETNNAGFEVQVDRGAGYEVLGFVDGHGTTTEAQLYTFGVTNLTPGTHSFRLKQIDYDGAFEYFGGVEVSIETPGQFVLLPTYPNPFNPEATIRFAVRDASPVSVTVHDVLGRQVATIYQGTPEANQTMSFRLDGSSLTSGTYVVRLAGSNGTMASQRITLLK